VAGRRSAYAPQEAQEAPPGTGLLVGAMCPIRPNVVWALDYQFDQTADGRTIKLLNIIDEFTREALAIEVERSIDADAVVATLEKITTGRHRSTCASITGPSSSPMPSPTGAGSTMPAPCSSIQGHRGIERDPVRPQHGSCLGRCQARLWE